MSTTSAPMAAEDREAVIDIFNHYIENSFAAYPGKRLPCEAFGMLLNMCQGYPCSTARTETGEVVGFGMLRPYSPISSFASTAEVSYFIKPGFTGRGIGKSLLEHLIEGAGAKGITSILAGICSLNRAASGSTRGTVSWSAEGLPGSVSKTGSGSTSSISRGFCKTRRRDSARARDRSGSGVRLLDPGSGYSTGSVRINEKPRSARAGLFDGFSNRQSVKNLRSAVFFTG